MTMGKRGIHSVLRDTSWKGIEKARKSAKALMSSERIVVAAGEA